MKKVMKNWKEAAGKPKNKEQVKLEIKNIIQILMIKMIKMESRILFRILFI